jgi:hypothetical protein
MDELEYQPLASSGIIILDQAANGFIYQLETINTPIGVRVVALQVIAPPPPTWIEMAVGELGASDGVLGAALALVIFWERLRGYWRNIRGL